MKQSLTIALLVLIILSLLFMIPIYLMADGEWSRKSDMPTAREALSTSVVDGKIYAIGGVKVGRLALAAVEVYNPVMDKWTVLDDMPTARWALASCTVNGKIYIIGGLADGGRVLSTLEEYNPKTNIWTKRANMPTARYFLAVCVVEDRIYTIGGFNSGHLEVATVEEYDTVNDKWIRKSDMPTARGALGSCILDGKIYAIGGESIIGGIETPMAVVEEYNPKTDTWEQKADMPMPRNMSLATGVMNNAIYVFGGFTVPLMNGIAWKSSKTIASYDPKAGLWIDRGNMLTARSNASASVVNNKLYLIGGLAEFPIAIDNFKSLSIVEEYTPEGWKFFVSPKDKLPVMWGNIKND